MKRIICLLLCLLLCGQVFAAKPNGIESKMQAFISEHGLNESNFSVSYYNLSNHTSYSYNEDAFFSAGKLWTLPLHMYYYEEEANGAFLPSLESPEEFLIGGMSLEDCRYHSIILAEESASVKMRDEIGSIAQYQELINSRYGHIEAELLPTSYWEGTAYSARFLMNCLMTVDAHPELYGIMMSNFHFAQKADAFAGNNSPYNLVQIRGEADGFVCAVAEVSALQPYLIVAFVSEEAGGDSVLADLNDMLCTYIEELSGTEPTVPTTTQRESSNANYYVGEKDNAQEEMLTRWFLIAFGAAAIVALITGVIVLLLRKKKHHHRQ